MPTLKELFTKQKGGPITVDGRELLATYCVPVKDGDVLKFDFLRSAVRPVQGISLVGRRCQLEVRGTAGAGIELWTNSAPKHVEIKVVRAKQGATVDIVNQWIDEKYGTSRHVNNAAIEIEQQAGDTLLLRCSDGVGDADFDDLVLQLVVTPSPRAIP